MSQNKIYQGIDKEPRGGMTPTANIVRDAWVFGIIPESETCAGWTVQGIDALYDKVVSNMHEVRARGGRIVAVTTQGNGDLSDLAEHVLRVPRTPPLLSPVITSIPLQLLAYHIAVLRGCDVDRPRNLAKSVTVE